MIFILMFEEIGFSESKWDGIDIWEYTFHQRLGCTWIETFNILRQLINFLYLIFTFRRHK